MREAYRGTHLIIICLLQRATLQRRATLISFQTHFRPPALSIGLFANGGE